MNFNDLPEPQEILDVLEIHAFALHAAAEELEQLTDTSKQKWLAVVLRKAKNRSAESPPQEFHSALKEILEAAKEVFSEDFFPPGASPPQP